MAIDLSSCLVVGISSRALFDLRREDALFVSAGLDAYRAEQLVRAFTDAGFAPPELYDGPEFGPFDPKTSDGLMLVACPTGG